MGCPLATAPGHSFTENAPNMYPMHSECEISYIFDYENTFTLHKTHMHIWPMCTLSIAIKANWTYSSYFMYSCIKIRLIQVKSSKILAIFATFHLDLTANKICPNYTKHFFLMEYWENACIWLDKLVTWPKFGQIHDFSDLFKSIRVS